MRRVPISSRRAVRNVIPSRLRVPTKSDPTYMGELLATTQSQAKCADIHALVSSVVILERRKAIPTLPLI